MKIDPTIAIRDWILSPIERVLPPERVLRIAALCCLLGCGMSAVLIAKNVGSLSSTVQELRDLQVYLAVACLIFAAFYIEHRLLLKFSTCRLGNRLGYWQAFGSSALVFVGAREIMTSAKIGVSSDGLLWLAAMFGEAMLLRNVIRFYTSDELAGIVPPRHSPQEPGRGGDNFGWPRSPAKLFGIASLFLAVGGVVSVAVNFPDMKFSAPLAGRLHFLPFGCLWLIAAVPLAIYARLYKTLLEVYGLVLDQSLTRLHFAITIIGEIVLIWEFARWQESMVSQTAALYLDGDVKWFMAPLMLSALVFGLNIYRGIRSGPHNRRPRISWRVPRSQCTNSIRG